MDFTAIVCGFALSFALRFSEPILSIAEVTKGYPPFSAYMYGALAIAPMWIILFQRRKMYGARRQVDLSSELFDVIRVVTFGMLIVLSVTFFFREFSYSRIVFVFIWFVSIACIFLGRVVILEFERLLYHHGKERRNVLLIGANATAQHLASRIHHRPTLGYNLIGYCSDNDEFIESVATNRLGDVDAIPSLVIEHKIETLLICLPAQERDKLQQIIEGLEGKNIQILLQPEVIGIVPTRLRIHEIFGIPFLGIKDIPMTTWGGITKRAFDIAFSFTVIVLSLPFACITAIIIWLESRGPIFYTQVRVGLDGHEFVLYKFRSMKKDAERESGPTWTRKGDPRITRFGRILRRSSFDEMPQFMNVFLGQMSVVGPRPERPEFVQQFRNYVPKYVERHRLKTGITGWAQVNGLRGETPIAERTKYDLYYIENWSLTLDIRIIFKTLQAVIFGKDAY